MPDAPSSQRTPVIALLGMFGTTYCGLITIFIIP
nr:MAG TPA: G-rich domain on putative tyrosine kinase [Caudoviricetes sp.]